MLSKLALVLNTLHLLNLSDVKPDVQTWQYNQKTPDIDFLLSLPSQQSRHLSCSDLCMTMNIEYLNTCSLNFFWNPVYSDLTIHHSKSDYKFIPCRWPTHLFLSMINTTCWCSHDGSGGHPQLKFINNWNVVECEVMNTNYSFHGWRKTTSQSISKDFNLVE